MHNSLNEKLFAETDWLVDNQTIKKSHSITRADVRTGSADIMPADMHLPIFFSMYDIFYEMKHGKHN